jgi:hypothetical protein
MGARLIDRWQRFCFHERALGEVCQHGAILEQRPVSDPRWVSYFGAGGEMAMMRMLAIMDVAQAVAGIAVGCVYAVWLTYPA